MITDTRQLDTTELEQRVKRMYEEVALEPGEAVVDSGTDSFLAALAGRVGYRAAPRLSRGCSTASSRTA
jgi:hypothetical protein